MLTVYRPSSSSVKEFKTEFSSLLETMVSLPSELIISGDFNFHVDSPNEANSKSFLRLLESFSLKQHVNFPTHIRGHTLDLLITRFDSEIIQSVGSVGYISHVHTAYDYLGSFGVLWVHMA